MAMILCDGCRTLISDEAYPCPKCGMQYPEKADAFTTRLADEYIQKQNPGSATSHSHNGKTFVGWKVRSLPGTRQLDGNPGVGWYEEYFVTRDLFITTDKQVLVLEKHWYEGSGHRGQGDVSYRSNPMPMDHSGRIELRRIVRGY